MIERDGVRPQPIAYEMENGEQGLALYRRIRAEK